MNDPPFACFIEFWKFKVLGNKDKYKSKIAKLLKFMSVLKETRVEVEKGTHCR